AEPFYHFLEDPALGRIVVDNQYVTRHSLALRCTPVGAVGRCRPPLRETRPPESCWYTKGKGRLKHGLAHVRPPWPRHVEAHVAVRRRHGDIEAAVPRSEGRRPMTAIPRAAATDPATAATPKSQLDPDALPEWDLGDLYDGIDSPALKADLDRAARDADAFAADYAGRVGDIATGPDAGARLADAIRRYEALQEVMGRIMSYAGLLYAGDSSVPVRAKFYGDMQDTITTISTRLLFFELELNRIDDGVLDAALATPDLARYAPWLHDLRRERPHQLDETLERLFHEKSVTGRAAWNRLFDETISSLRFTVGGEELTIEPTLSLLLDPDRDKRRAAADAMAETFSRNLRLFTLVTNTLARDKAISDTWRKFEDVADSRHLANRVERPVVEALVDAVRNAYPDLSHRYYRMKARWLGLDRLEHYDRNAPLPEEDRRTIPWSDAQRTVLDAYRSFAPEMAEIAGWFFDRRWIDAPVRPGKAPGAFS